MWNVTGPRRWHDQLSFALVGEVHGEVQALFKGASLFTLSIIVCKCSAECAAAITRLITEFVARDLRLLSIVYRVSF